MRIAPPSDHQIEKKKTIYKIDKETLSGYNQTLISSISHWVNHSKSKNIVEGEYKEYAQWLFDKIKHGKNSKNEAEFEQIEQFVHHCLKSVFISDFLGLFLKDFIQETCSFFYVLLNQKYISDL